jgi:putative CocE/NonD family hydrolase
MANKTRMKTTRTPTQSRRGSRPRALLALAALTVSLLTVAAPSARAEIPPPTVGPTGFVTMSDGTEIAINVRMPKDYRKGGHYPTIFEMSGYDGASNNDKTVLGYLYEDGVPDNAGLGEGSRQLTKWFYDHYVTVHASVRGTGCSGGEFDLFSWRSALDGREVIEWIAQQDWSNGKVGIMGHSYSGITGFMVAATQPPHLVAITTSGLIDDLYRAITYPNGVSNIGFPVLWTLGVRPAYDILGATAQPLLTDDEHRVQCLKNIATHSRTILNDPVVQGLGQQTDNGWYQVRSLINYANRIKVPIHITGAYQDEQTGPRGPAHLWEAVQGVPKRLVLSNGDHGTNQSRWMMETERVPWMDHWMRGVNKGHGTLAQDKTSVRVLFEGHHTADGDEVPNEIMNRRTFPLEDTTWTDWYMRKDGGLSTKPPGSGEGSDAFVAGTERQSWFWETGENGGEQFSGPAGPDEVNYLSPAFTRPTAIAGPVTANLYMSSTATDTDMFVQLIDEGPDGSHSYLQRGILKASHRAYDAGQSDWAVRHGRNQLYRPYRPDVNPTNITPLTVYNYLVEIWPIGHIFRPGHRLLVKVMAPPLTDSYYAYAPQRAPSVNSVFHEPELASRITVALVPLTGIKLGPELGCGEQVAVRCLP